MYLYILYITSTDRGLSTLTIYHREAVGLQEFFHHSDILSCITFHYAISGYGVSRPGIQNKKGFCIKINLPKGNY